MQRARGMTYHDRVVTSTVVRPVESIIMLSACYQHARTYWRSLPGDLHAPDFRSLRLIRPLESARMLGVELVPQRAWIVIVDENHRLTFRESGERTKDGGVLVARRNDANVQLDGNITRLWCG